MPGWSTGMFHGYILYSSLDHRLTALTKTNYNLMRIDKKNFTKAILDDKELFEKEHILVIIMYRSVILFLQTLTKEKWRKTIYRSKNYSLWMVDKFKINFLFIYINLSEETLFHLMRITSTCYYLQKHCLWWTFFVVSTYQNEYGLY